MKRAALAFALAAAILVLVGASQAAPGQLDPGFGKRGKVVTRFGAGDAEALAAARQRNGKIVVAGQRERSSDTSAFALVRYRVNGKLDRTFSSDGKVTTALGDSAVATDVAIQSDGKILAAGANTDSIGERARFALARYLPNGSLDASFGDGGTVSAALTGKIVQGLAVAIQPDGKIVVAGAAAPHGSSDYDFALARFEPTGALDPSFGIGGWVTLGFGADASDASAVAIQTDGKIVAAGRRFKFAEDTLTLHGFALARFNPDGGLDATFGSDGQVTTEVGAGGGAFSVLVQADGKIVAAGTSSSGHPPEQDPVGGDFALARYLDDGTLDASFGGDGIVTTDLGSRNDYIHAAAIRSDGKIIAAGSSIKTANYAFAVARYRPNGSLDRGFGRRGRVKTVVRGDLDVAHDVVSQPNGKVVAVGEAFDATTGKARFALVRYLDMQPVCVVPNVKRESSIGAKLKIIYAHCTLGRVRQVYSRKVEEGRVISQRPKPGVRLPARSRVNLVFSKGRRHRR